MLQFVNKIIDKIKSIVLQRQLNNITHKLNVLETVNINDKLICKILKLHDFDFCIVVKNNLDTIHKQVAKHNVEVAFLQQEFDKLIQSCPQDYFLNHINSISLSQLNAIEHIINQTFKYKILNSLQNKQYNDYQRMFSVVKNNYEKIKQQKTCIDFIQLTLKNLPDKYIDFNGKKEMSINLQSQIQFLNQSRPLFYQIPDISTYIEDYNLQFINAHIEDSIFNDVNGKSLDIDQRKAILCNPMSNLTIAGAGSGKTLTICGKVKYLVENKLAKPDEILLLSYSKDSSVDLSNKIHSLYEDMQVSTFHSLGLNIIKDAKQEKPAIEEQFSSYITQFFQEAQNDPVLLNKIFTYISLYMHASHEISKKYDDLGSQYEDLKGDNLKTLKDFSLEHSNGSHQTLKKEYVKSNEELCIANWLFINGINYEYEVPYFIKTSTYDKRQYMPDFYLPDYKIYIEHYGVNKQNRTPQYSTELEQEYLDGMQWKRNKHSSNNTTCIETYSWQFAEGCIFQELEKQLKLHDVKFAPLSENEVSDFMNNIIQGYEFTSLSNLISSFISLYKAQYENEKHFHQLQSQFQSNNYNHKRQRLFLEICEEAYCFYINKIRKFNKIDFDDMILQAQHLLPTLSNYKYKYIIVDEFQDISNSRQVFLSALIKHGNSKLFAVGDDWQAIYRFAGCDVNIFLNFDKYFDDTKINFITSTHRNSLELQKIVGPFIMANPMQYKKDIKSAKSQKDPVRIVYHNQNHISALNTALKEISNLNQNANVLILGRNRKDIEPYICNRIQCNNYKLIIHKDFPNMNISYNTVHGSKGLESDYVIVLNCDNALNGFPNKMEDDIVLSLLLNKTSSYTYDEERRLFYVALTRTRSIVYLITNQNKPSQFIKEIEPKCQNLYIDGTDLSIEYEHCPTCKRGKVITRNGPYGQFYGCTNYPYCHWKQNIKKQ